MGKPEVMIRGLMPHRTVLIGDKRLYPQASLKLRNHSPDGFNWGYSGSGPSQLALAILLELTGQQFALANYQDFKFAVIDKLPRNAFMLPVKDVITWAEKNGWKGAE